MLVVGKHAWFTANAPKTGIELYRTTGLPRSATLIKDIRPGAGSSRPLHLQAVKVGSKTLVFFQADDGKTGPELWVSDGTAAGTKLVKDIRAGLGGSWPILGGSFQGKLWFSANDGILGSELWVSDGTTAGTKRFKDLRKGSWGSWPRYFTEFQGKLYFQANDGTNGTELWQSDGSVAGTKMLANLRKGVGSSSPFEFTAVGKKLYFVASGNSGGELYTTDGTAAGTKLALDLVPGVGSGGPIYLTAVGSRYLYFASSMSGKGSEPYRTDGTLAGTQMWDLNLGNFGSNPFVAWSGIRMASAAMNGRIYFGAMDASKGREIWYIDNGDGDPHRGSVWQQSHEGERPRARQADPLGRQHRSCKLLERPLPRRGGPQAQESRNAGPRLLRLLPVESLLPGRGQLSRQELVHELPHAQQRGTHGPAGRVPGVQSGSEDLPGEDRGFQRCPRDDRSVVLCG